MCSRPTEPEGPCASPIRAYYKNSEKGIFVGFEKVKILVGGLKLLTQVPFVWSPAVFLSLKCGAHKICAAVNGFVQV